MRGLPGTFVAKKKLSEVLVMGYVARAKVCFSVTVCREVGSSGGERSRFVIGMEPNDGGRVDAR